MRALVDSAEVKDLFPQELAELKEGVVGWKPVTKVLREIKKRVRLYCFAHAVHPSCSGTHQGSHDVWCVASL